MSYLVINGDCLEALQTLDPVTCIFADPPDNIGLGYASIKDTMTEDEYTGWLKEVVWACVNKAEICWFSFNARWTFHMGSIFLGLKYAGFEIKPCVQVFKFGNYNSKDLTNCHRPLWRAMKHNAILYPEQIKIESVRQKMGDKRAQQGGKVPGDTIEIGSHLSETEVMEIYLATGSRGSLAKQYGVTSATVQAIKNGLAFAHITNRIAMADVERAPRITGNSKQRRSWHPTQLNEHLVER